MASQVDVDRKRDEFLAKQGWSIIHIKTNQSIPSMDQLLMAMHQVTLGEDVVQIELSDWGIGPTFGDVVGELREAD
jgi:hypothetical protein